MAEEFKSLTDMRTLTEEGDEEATTGTRGPTNVREESSHTYEENWMRYSMKMANPDKGRQKGCPGI